MSHINKVIDADPHFVIDINTRNIKNVSQTKTSLVQYDHNSERFSFTLPRFIEGHNMMECNSVQVHYFSSANPETKGVYDITDLASCEEDEENVCCTWLISRNVTQTAGALQFMLRFACLADDGTVEYAWHTNTFTGISITAGMNNAEAVVEQYADILEQWKVELFSLTEEGIRNINTATLAVIEDIEKAGERVANSLPDDYSTMSKKVRSIESCIYNVTGLEKSQTVSSDYAITTNPSTNKAGVTAAQGYSVHRYYVTEDDVGKNIFLNLNSFAPYISAAFSATSTLSSGFISFANDGDIIPQGTTILFVTTQNIGNDTVGVRHSNLDDVDELGGKTIYACGDSITKGANNDNVSYVTKIARKHNMQLTNLAISGSTIVKTLKSGSVTEYRGCIREMIDEMITMPEPDYIIVSGGYNDSQTSISNPLGVVLPFDTYENQSTAFAGNYDVSTVAGGLEAMFYKLNQNFPNAKILYVITYKIVAAFQWSNVYIPTIKEACAKWGISYVDLSENGRLINDANLMQRTNIFTDGVHPNDKGYTIMADLVEKKLKTI